MAPKRKEQNESKMIIKSQRAYQYNENEKAD